MFGKKPFDYYLVRVENSYGDLVWYGGSLGFTSNIDKAIHYSDFNEAYAIQCSIQDIPYVKVCAICHYKEIQ